MLHLPVLSLEDLSAEQKFVFLSVVGLNLTQYLICEETAEFEVIEHEYGNFTRVRNIDSGEIFLKHKMLPVAPRMTREEFFRQEFDKKQGSC